MSHFIAQPNIRRAVSAPAASLPPSSPTLVTAGKRTALPPDCGPAHTIIPADERTRQRFMHSLWLQSVSEIQEDLSRAEQEHAHQRYIAQLKAEEKAAWDFNLGKTAFRESAEYERW